MPTGRCAVVTCFAYADWIIGALCVFGLLMLVVMLFTAWRR